MRRVVFAIGLLGIVAHPASGHHSEAGFDKGTVVAFDGTVIEYAWRNPHIYIVVETTDSAGESVQWQVETSSTPILRRRGWSRDSLRPGEVVSIRGHPERDTDRDYTLLLTLEKEDGSVMTAESVNPRAVATASNLSGVWKGDGPTGAEFRRRLNSLALTEKGVAAKDSYNLYTDDPVARCIAHTSPRLLFTGATDNVNTGLYVHEIELGDDVVVMRSEYFDVERTVFMDGRGHPDNAERTLQGHSIGRWEDDTLVVDTRLFADHRIGNGFGVPSGAQKHVIERYTLSEDRTRILVDIFLEDPEYLAESLTGRMEWLYTPEFQLYGYDCDLENSRVFRLD